ncbi:MAG: dethiobiotin synthase [Bacteroidetes bacterium GWA2_30_7]|nr:MAG: dethiobiotin synthase [Bacteroidetes bacterium GWA2_30_7]
MKNKVIFVTGIDTDCGKTIVTGLLAKYLQNIGKKIITQKLVQTGCLDISEDIIFHRKIMKIALLEEDKNKTTCSYIFKLPASPRLAAKAENEEINIEKILNSTNILLEKFEYVLIEGAGGLYVPLNENITTIDYIKSNNYPVILVSSSKLGSINHTLLSLEAIKNKRLDLTALIYNEFPNKNSLITNDTKQYLQNYLKHNFPESKFYSIPGINKITDFNFEFDEII